MVRTKIKIINDNEQNTAILRGLLPEEQVVFKCEDASELDSITQTAYKVKRENRPDGYKYKIIRKAKDMQVAVSLLK